MMIRACVDGHIDFSSADLTDIWWHLKLNLLMAELFDREMMQYLKFCHQRHLAYIGVAGLTEESWKRHQEGETETYEDYVRLLLGLAKEEGKERRQQMEDAMKSAWEREFGETSNPETQVKIDATALQLRLMREHGGERDFSNTV